MKNVVIYTTKPDILKRLVFMMRDDVALFTTSHIADLTELVESLVIDSVVIDDDDYEDEICEIYGGDVYKITNTNFVSVVEELLSAITADDFELINLNGKVKLLRGGE